jgi:DNA ligase 1
MLYNLIILNMSLKVMLAHNYTDQDITNWWMSEKLDGIRAYWTGEKFLTRTGKAITPPQFFIDEMPKDIILDGELCAGRNKFNLTSSIVRKTKNVENYVDDWANNITYNIFDTVCDYPFERRIGILYDQITNYKFVKIVKQTKVNNKNHLDKELERIIDLDGEGLMLREPESMYERKRSKSLLKVKKFHDMEVKIIGYREGTGKYKGMLGSYECETLLGSKFNCGSGLNDNNRLDRLDIGTFITVKYFDLSVEGVPRFPIYMRVAERQQF